MKRSWIETNKYIIMTIILLILSLILITIPVKNASTLKKELSDYKKTQVQYINENMSIIPDIINISKGYIIHNEEILKTIIKINILTKTKNNNINAIYKNQLSILDLTDSLIEVSQKNPALSNNKKFQQLKDKFYTLYNTVIKNNQICTKKSKQLIKYAKLPIYNKIIEIKNLNDIICINNYDEQKKNFNF